MIDYLQPPFGYLLRIPCGDDAADTPLDEPARDRAEQAAAFLRYERIGRIYETNSNAARETSMAVWLSCSPDFTDYIYSDLGPDNFCKFLLDPDRGLPCVLVSTQREIEAALKSLIPGANVCGELVAPGGIISLHRSEEKIVPRARHMILDFSFTDLERTVAWKETTPA